MPEVDIRKIKVVSNTHWDREFRQSFEKTRHSLIRMMDTTIKILEKDPNYHSFTMDGHTIMIDDYLEMKPEMQERIEKLVREGRLIIGPYYTLAEEFSIGDEALVRNLIWGRRMTEKYGGKPGTVAYTPSSWGQTGQLPQILKDFGLDKVMFYRGISHHESDAEYIWSAPDGTRVYASRFAIYARYNWYYQVHRMVTRGTVFDKTFHWGKYNEIPVRPSDQLSGSDPSFVLKDPTPTYKKDFLKKAIENMLDREAGHFTTPVFLAMNGHDISVAYPEESQIIKDAQDIFEGKLEIEHCSLEDFWEEALPYLKENDLPVLKGERRSFLKEGMWTYLFPGTISARTYLKQQDSKAFYQLKNEAEPLASLAMSLGMNYPEGYIEKGWTWLMSNHTHDANGGCAPDVVCWDMEYRYRKVNDIAGIVREEAIDYIVKYLDPLNLDEDSMQFVVFNSRPFYRNAVVPVDLEIPSEWNAKSIELIDPEGEMVETQLLTAENSSVFVDSIWEVPTILSSTRLRFYASLKNIPATGYKVLQVRPHDFEHRNNDSLVTGPESMENEYLRVRINNNGSIDLLNMETGKWYRNLNYLYDQGEAGNAWQHVDLPYEKKINSLGVNATISIVESGALRSVISAEFSFCLPEEYLGSERRSDRWVELPVKVFYTLEKGRRGLKVRVELINKAKDHWLRACFPTALQTEQSWAGSHFDVVSRSIKLPDSTGWVEEVQGTHPLQSFVSLNDEKEGLAIFPRGLFEYEILRDKHNTIALTLLRACRIKLKVSEEKTTELDDLGIQCPGKQIFEYMIYPYAGDWKNSALLKVSDDYIAPFHMVQSGIGKGNLPHKYSLINSINPVIQISAVKKAEKGNGLIIRLYNPSENEEDLHLKFNTHYKKIIDCGIAEDREELIEENTAEFKYKIKPKKILTFKLVNNELH